MLYICIMSYSISYNFLLFVQTTGSSETAIDDADDDDSSDAHSAFYDVETVLACCRKVYNKL